MSGNIVIVIQSIDVISSLVFSSDGGRILYLMALGRVVSDGNLDVNTTAPHTDCAAATDEFSNVKTDTISSSLRNAEIGNYHFSIRNEKY